MPCQRRMHERTFGARAAKELRRELKEQGVRAAVDAEPVYGTRNWRLIMRASRFRTMRQPERDAFAWSVVRRALGATDAKRVESVVTLTPAESAPWRGPLAISIPA